MPGSTGGGTLNIVGKLQCMYVITEKPDKQMIVRAITFYQKAIRGLTSYDTLSLKCRSIYPFVKPDYHCVVNEKVYFTRLLARVSSPWICIVASLICWQ